MSDILLLLTGAVFVNHLVLTQLPGARGLTDDSGRLHDAVAMAIATACAMTLSSIGIFLLHHYLLLPFDATFLRMPAYVLIIATVVRLTKLALQTSRFMLSAGVHAHVVTVTCVVLSVAAINDDRSTTFVEAMAWAFGTSCAFSLALLLFSTMVGRLNMGEVPAPFRGSALSLITVALVSLAFMGFAGLV